MCDFKKIIVSMILFSLPCNQALAYLEFDKNISSSASFSFAGPVDKTGYGSIPYNSGSTDTKICNSSSLNYTLAKIVTVPVATWTGRTYQASSAHAIITLFESGVSGFSLSPQGGPLASGYPANWSPLQPNMTTLWTGSTPNSTRVSSGFAIRSGIYVYKDETRFVGSAQIPEQVMFKYLCQDSSGVTQEAYNFKINPISIIGTVTGCTPDSSAAIINMDTIAQKTLEAADSSTLLSTKKFTASLLCDPNINVYVSVVDLSDTSNVTNIASLTSDSTAKGVGFAVTDSSGTQLKFGPDGSATSIPGQVKYFIQQAASASSSQNNRVSTQFGFSYVRKTDEAVQAGSAKAVIGLTYSYQ